MIESVIELFKKMNVPKAIMVFGILLMLAAGANESLFGITIVEGSKPRSWKTKGYGQMLT